MASLAWRSPSVTNSVLSARKARRAPKCPLPDMSVPVEKDDGGQPKGKKQKTK
jgi:hypothetical protein